MENETKFGKQVYSCSKKAGMKILKVFLLFPPIILLILTFTVFNDGPSAIYYQVIAVLLSVLALYWVFFGKQYKEIVVYENGIVFTLGSKVTELDFCDVKGINDATIVTKLYGVINAGQTRYAAIVKHNGEKHVFTKALVSELEQLADNLGAAFTKYLLREVTAETLDKAYISFGDSLELTGGLLVHDAGAKKGKVSIPLNAVRNVAFDDDGYWLTLEGEKNEKGKPEKLAMIRADKALNLTALLRILDAFRQ